MAQKATTGADGKTYRMVCLDLRSLPGWLFGLNASKVAPEARPALVAYQREAADVLYRHFLETYAPAPPLGVLETQAIEVGRLRGQVADLAAEALALRGSNTPKVSQIPRVSRGPALSCCEPIMTIGNQRSWFTAPWYP